MNQRQRIVGEARPAKQLIQRAAEHEGKVGRLSWRSSIGVIEALHDAGAHTRAAANRRYGLTVTAAFN